MPISYNPGISYRGDQYAFQGLAGLGQGLGQALTDYQKKRAAEQQKIEELQREKQKNDIILGTYKELGLLKPEEHSAYMAAPIKQQSAMASGFGERVALKYAMESRALQQQVANQQLQNSIQQFSHARQLFPIQQQTAQVAATNAAPTAEAELKQRRANADLTEAKAWEAWQGGGEGAAVNLSPEEIAQGKAVGRIPLRQSRGSFQWAQAASGGQTSGWMKDPNDPSGTKYIGFQQADGDIKFLPRPSDVVELIQRGVIKLDEKQPPVPLQAAETPVPTATPGPTATDKFVVGQKYKDAQGNTATYLGNGQWQ